MTCSHEHQFWACIGGLPAKCCEDCGRKLGPGVPICYDGIIVIAASGNPLKAFAAWFWLPLWLPLLDSDFRVRLGPVVALRAGYTALFIAILWRLLATK